jgi:hypothetical protein
MELSAVRLLTGVILLFLGRRLFWLFVGLLGFFAGISFATQFFSQQPDWVRLLLAVICGVIGIFLALFLQRLAIAVAGFLAGGLFTTSFVEMMGWQAGAFLPFVIGGILGAILLSLVFDLALIFLSSLTGAMLVVRALPLEPMFSGIVFLVLLILGMIVQARWLPPATVRKRPASA